SAFHRRKNFRRQRTRNDLPIGNQLHRCFMTEGAGLALDRNLHLILRSSIIYHLEKLSVLSLFMFYAKRVVIHELDGAHAPPAWTANPPPQVVTAATNPPPQIQEKPWRLHRS